MRRHNVRNSNQILRGDQTISRENFYLDDHAICPDEKFYDTNADARSVCGS